MSACSGCNGTGAELSGTTYGGLSEEVGCGQCGPDCAADCGCRVDDDLALIAKEPVESCERCGSVLPPPYDLPEWAKSVALCHPGATQSPDGSQGATEGLRGPESATGYAVSDAEAADHRPAAALEAELDPAEFRTKPNPDQPDRCPSIDPHDTLQCTRRIHEDGQCQSGGIAWVKGTPRYMSDAERANRMEGMAERLAERLVDVEERLTGERDRARGTAATLEAENARLTEALYLTMITLEATFRVLQEASGLPDDIDDPDCRDEMVLALRPRAEKAEAENARLRERIAAYAATVEDDCQGDLACDVHHVDFVTVGDWRGCAWVADLRALLTEGGETRG